MNKYLEILKNAEDQEMFKKVASFLEEFSGGMSQIQIENFILNDVEFPTPYGKFQQAKFELLSRFQQLIDVYYDIRTKEIKIKQKERQIENSKDDLEKELFKIEKEKLEVQLLSTKNKVKTLVKEARIFFKTYQEHPEFHKLNPQEAFDLEAENWVKKTLNMPTIFEERYGKNYMVKALGEENYKKYLEVRRKGFGLLPREIFEIKQLEDKK